MQTIHSTALTPVNTLLLDSFSFLSLLWVIFGYELIHTVSLKAESLSGESVRAMLEAPSPASFSCLWPSADPSLSATDIYFISLKILVNCTDDVAAAPGMSLVRIWSWNNGFLFWRNYVFYIILINLFYQRASLFTSNYVLRSLAVSPQPFEMALLQRLRGLTLHNLRFLQQIE